MNIPDSHKVRNFFVKGPVGLGIKFIPNNLNVIFVAGTGILTIMDYLARFALYNCGERLEEKFDNFGRYYKLILFYAVESEELGLGLKMLRLL